jgi:hypothetical protein
VPVTAQEPNGPITNDFSPQPQGRLNFDANGNYSLMVMASDSPKFASNDRVSGTANENEAAVKGSISHFGHYSVNNGDIDFKIEYSTFPNGTSRTTTAFHYQWRQIIVSIYTSREQNYG